jgi:hypothetical protein
VAAAFLAGCAVHEVHVDGAPGSIATRLGRPGFVVAAPHGLSDPRTGEIAAEIARRTGFGLVVATGFALEPDRPDGPGRRYQVNRPLEGVPGTPASREVASEGARAVYEAWEAQVRRVAQGPLALYVEIHGNNRRAAADRIEIATVGVDRDEAVRLRTLLELIRDAHLTRAPGAPRLLVLVEPADPVLYTASGAKRAGILRLPARALHIELPRAARTEWRQIYTAVLAEFLAQAAVLPGPR